jgi:hypothetical protein
LGLSKKATVGKQQAEGFRGMRVSRGFVALVGALTLVAGALSAAGKSRLPEKDENKVLHALNRLTWGPAPGDIERVRRMGLKKWIDEQLHPE